jgi:DNA-binding PadR family transcriptional regulator
MNNEYLKRLLIISKAIDAPPEEPSERATELFEAALARRQPFTVKSEKQMKVIILQLLKKGGRLDGAEILEKLEALRCRLKLEGDGVIYALLARMEEENLVIGKFDSAMVRKTYQMDDTKGRLLLKKNLASEGMESERIDAVFAT